MKISDIRATSVTVPLEAPLRHANGCHWGRFVRTIVEVETDEGLVGLGEMGGGGESAEAMFLRAEGVPRRPRPGAARADAVPHRQPDGLALQQPHAGPGRARVRLPGHPRPEVGRAGLRDPGGSPARPRTVRLVPVLPLPESGRGGRGADGRAARRPGARAEGASTASPRTS